MQHRKVNLNHALNGSTCFQPLLLVFYEMSLIIIAITSLLDNFIVITVDDFCVLSMPINMSNESQVCCG